jgi:release factor glutamine methyltransferase
MPAENAAAAPPTWTIKALLEATAKVLIQKGAADTPREARLEAELLLAHALGCKRIDLLVRYDEVPADEEKSAFRDLVRRRADRWPTAYLVGTREFYLLPFEVSPAVLIPRPETETLVLRAIEAVKGNPAPRVLDLGTGSGCVAVSLAHRLKTAAVTAADVSPDALAVARRNAARNGVADRVTFVQGDLFAPLPADARFDLIVSNPPYVTPTELAGLDPEVRDHEPRLALDGGPDGLAFYRRIAADAGRFLRPGGSLLVEVGATQSAAVQALFDAGRDIAHAQTVKDTNGIPRVVIARHQ